MKFYILRHLSSNKAEQNQLKITFNNARSLYKHFNKIKLKPNIISSNAIGFSERRLTITDEQNFKREGYQTLFNQEERNDRIRLIKEQSYMLNMII